MSTFASVEDNHNHTQTSNVKGKKIYLKKRMERQVTLIEGATKGSAINMNNHRCQSTHLAEPRPVCEKDLRQGRPMIHSDGRYDVPRVGNTVPCELRRHRLLEIIERLAEILPWRPRREYDPFRWSDCQCAHAR